MAQQNQQQALATIGVDVNLTPLSAVYLALAIILPIIVFFVAQKYIH